MGALFALGCGTSSIEAVVSDDVTAQAGSPSTVLGDEICHEPAAGNFVLKAETGCLARGGATTVFGRPAVAVELSDCASPAQWELTPAQAGTFTIRNVEANLVLDVRAGGDLPGTPLILYDANLLDHQRFWFRPRAADAYEIAPRHAPTLCAEARADSVAMRSCEPENRAQAFVLERSSCL